VLYFVQYKCGNGELTMVGTWQWFLLFVQLVRAGIEGKLSMDAEDTLSGLFGIVSQYFMVDVQASDW
jgi:hypothetical protein